MQLDKFYMGANSSGGGGIIRGWGLNRGFTVINFSSLYHTYFFCSIFCSSSSRLYIHFHIITVTVLFKSYKYHTSLRCDIFCVTFEDRKTRIDLQTEEPHLN